MWTYGLSWCFALSPIYAVGIGPHFTHVFEPQNGACTTIAVIPVPDGPKSVCIWGEKSAEISDETRGEDVNMSRPLF